MSGVIRLRLEDKDSGEKRFVSVGADSAEEAAAIVEAQEAKKVSFVLSPEEVADFDKRLKDGSLSGRDKARLFAHRQEKPYVIVRAKDAK